MKFAQKKTFMAWLENKMPDVIVGEGCSSGECPLANFLRERGAAAPYVRPDTVLKDSCWRLDRSDDFSPLPAWANSYAMMVDRCGSTPLSALAALALAKML